MTPQPNLPPVLQASALEGRAPDGRRLFALSTLALQPGLTLVLGDEGAGKTTLLRMLAGDMPHWVGHAVLCGHDQHTAADAYHSEVAWLDPASQSWEQVVVDELWAQQARHFARWSPDTLEDLVEALDLQAHRHKPLYMLSTGSRRKALMAAALASGAALTLLDMPFAALDGATSRTLRDILADCADHPQRAFVIADYSAPAGVAAQQVLNLDELGTK
ncbi:MAG: ATP-binding cassette domain-containing protein [Rhodoferax sp.]|nr:MAG: ATP-binding cassette domain-containing protein [Rhodoferax sp.]